MGVSIHAPARGATYGDARVYGNDWVSIHAPARGATLAHEIAELKLRFQSTHPHGVRLSHLQQIVCGFWFQSTHPHGVRHTAIFYLPPTRMFQSTHPHGVRQSTDAFKKFANGFQSTHPHGVRQNAPRGKCTLDSFNPRTRTGCDPGHCRTASGTPLFQSTHPHGVRLKLSHFFRLVKPVSIHAPARGAT